MRKRWVGLLIGALSVAVPRAEPPRFEDMVKIDAHSHVFQPPAEFVEVMRRVDLRLINICTRGTIPEWLSRRQDLAEQAQRTYPDLFAFASTFDVTHRHERNYHEQVREWLDRSFEAGAVMTKIWKEIGMEVREDDGSYLMPDDPVFDPIYVYLAEKGKPLLAHLADPVEAWLPLDPDNTHYSYYSTNPQWHVFGREGVPSHAEIIAARDHILEKHPDLIVIGAHFGSLSHDVDLAAQRLDRFPNFYLEVSGRTADLSRQPREKVRDFFVRYQDRILYGYDLYLAPREGSYPSEKVRAFVRRAEDQYRADFQYYAGSGRALVEGRDVECLALPRTVLEKFYNGNARRLLPGLGF